MLDYMLLHYVMSSLQTICLTILPGNFPPVGARAVESGRVGLYGRPPSLIGWLSMHIPGPQAFWTEFIHECYYQICQEHKVRN